MSDSSSGAAAAVQRIFQQVEQQTGHLVHAEADPTLRVIASVRVAGPQLPFHFIRFNPSAGPTVDYATAYQCGFILRQYALPPTDRFDVGPSYRGRKDVERLVTEHGRSTGSGHPKQVREQLRDQMLSGLMVQLRSMPIGMRIDDWLRAEAPELHEQQRASNERQLNENVAVLGPGIKQMAPEKVLRANASMNAAFAGYWARVWSDPRPIVPYKTAGYAGGGEQLIQLWDETPAGPENDRRLIDVWAEALGVNGWYEYIPRTS